MKKTLLTLLAFSMFSLVGCTGVNQQQTRDKNTVIVDSVQPQSKLSFTYSLMSDETTKTEIAALMKENDIPQANINGFFKSLNEFNELMGDMKGSTTGFETVNYPAALFDYDYIGTTWMKKYKFDDQQCRLTAFNLLKDNISIPSDPVVADPNYSISGDLEIQKTNPNINFTEDELKRFENLYVEIPVTSSTEPESIAAAIQEEWQNRGVSFNHELKSSLMSVFLYLPGSKVTFVGHAGIVLEADNGYVLVEKLAQYAPYIASKFNTLEEMKAYLVSGYDPATMGEPLIFLNDSWLQ